MKIQDEPSLVDDCWWKQLKICTVLEKYSTRKIFNPENIPPENIPPGKYSTIYIRVLNYT